MNEKLEVLAGNWAMQRKESTELYNYLVEKAGLKRAEILILQQLLKAEVDEAETVRQIKEAGFSFDEMLAYSGGGFNE